MIQKFKCPNCKRDKKFEYNEIIHPEQKKIMIYCSCGYWMEEEFKICCLCKQKYICYGNNASPLKDGVCCDECNKLVIIERLKCQK